MGDSEASEESLDDLFREIWERESKPELRFDMPGVGEIVQTQDLNGDKWSVNNFSNTVWEAAIWMHHFFQDQRCFSREWIRGCRILEVGAGTGLVGLTLALLGAEVMMTDLEEALPILAHNIDATFQSRSMCDSHGGDRDERDGLEALQIARRPMFRRLRWGSATDAADVATAAAAAVAGRTEAKWQGFDMIVGADIIYNESSYPALISTLSNSNLCSSTTIIYLATKLRGGRHEAFLDRLASVFHVYPLRDPRRSDEPESCVGRPVTRDEDASCSMDHRPAAHVPGSLVNLNVLGSKRWSSSSPACLRKDRGDEGDGEWSYGVSGLGTVLAFAAWERQ